MNEYPDRQQVLSFAKGSSVDGYIILDYDGGHPDEHESDRPCRPKGEGGSSAVFKVSQTLYGNVAIFRALKFFYFRPSLVDNHPGPSGPISSSNFAAEVLNISKLNHQNVMKVVEVGTWICRNFDIEVPYLVSEYIDGPDLQKAFDSGEFQCWLEDEPSLPLNLVEQFLEGLAYLHSRNFYHFDLAPKNLFIDTDTSEKRLVVGDLGLGKTLPSHSNDREVLVGSRGYTPSDIAENFGKPLPLQDWNTLQPRWDVYAAAKCILDLLEQLMSRSSRDHNWVSALKAFVTRVTCHPEAYTAADLLKFVKWVNPEQRIVAGVQELTSHFPGNTFILIPISEVFTSKRLRRVLDHPSILRLKEVPQLTMASAGFRSLPRC